MRKVRTFVLAWAGSAVLAGCLAIPSPVTVADVDDRYSMLTEPLVWKIGKTGRTIVVPAGFVTDYASIPPGVRAFIGKRGRHSRAAVVHDFLYWSQLCSRAQADNLMLIGMKEDDAGALRSWAIHTGVDLGGGFAWEANRKARKTGQMKVVPPAYRARFDDSSWPALQSQLTASGVNDGAYSTDNSYCQLGN